MLEKISMRGCSNVLMIRSNDGDDEYNNTTPNGATYILPNDFIF